MNITIYDVLDSKIFESTRSQVGFTMEVANSPLTIDENIYTAYQNRFTSIIEYFKGVIDVFKEAVHGNLSPEISKMFFGDCPSTIALEFHKSLNENIIKPPVFFRTDEATPGKILEIQCPGSQWGDYQVLLDALVENGFSMLNNFSLAENFTSQITKYLGKDPIIHHLLDNASIPHTMRYFIQRTRDKVKYFSYDKGIHPLDCNFIRSHSVYGLVSENYFLSRIKLANDSKLSFDLPPFIPFDEKISLALPFMDETKHFFSSKVREIIAFSTAITNDKIQLEDGSTQTLEEFSKRTRPNKNYYLKYAGSDVSINWGSRAVFRLSNEGQEKCLERLMNALKDYKENGRCWIIQKEEKCYQEIEWTKRDGSNCKSELPTSYRGFYGAYGSLGVMALHRNHNKIHGQEDTVVSICIPNNLSI